MRNPSASATIFFFMLMISPLFMPVMGSCDPADETGIAAADESLVDIESLIEELTHEDPDVRARAARQLGGLGVNAQQAMPVLSTLLEDADQTVRTAACDALAQMGPDAISYLIPALKLERYEVVKARSAPVSAFIHFGRAAVPPLVAALQIDNENARSNAALILGELWVENRNSDLTATDAHDVVQALIGVLNNDGEGVFVQSQAVSALGKIGPQAKYAVPVLTKLLFTDCGGAYPLLTAENTCCDQSLDETPLETSLRYAIARIGPEAAPPLIEALGAESPVTRIKAAFVLEQMMTRNQVGPAVPALLEKLKDPYAHVRNHAVLALATQNSLKDHMPTLEGLLKSDSDEARKAAARVLENMGPEAHEAVPLLTGLLKSEDAELRVNAARALLCIDRQNQRAALSSLFDAMSSSDKPAASAASNFLTWGSKKNIPDVTEFLSSDSLSDRRLAAKILSETRNDITGAMPALVRTLLHDKDPVLQGFVIAALRKEYKLLFAKDQAPGPDQQVLIQAFIQALAMDDDDTQMQAAAMLRDIGPQAESAVPALMEVLKDNNTEMRCYALSALSGIGPGAVESVPTLIALLSPDNFDTKIADRAVYALGRIGKDPENVVPVLIGLLDRDPMLVNEAMNALKRFGAQAAAAVPAIEKILLCPAPGRWYTGLLSLLPILHRGRAPNPCPYNKETAATALLIIDPEIAPVLVDAFRKIWREPVYMQGGDIQGDYHLAADILWLIGDDRDDPIPVLVQALSHKNRSIRYKAEEVLTAMGSQATQAVPLLIAMLDSEDPEVKDRAAGVLASLVDVTTLPESVQNRIPRDYWSKYHYRLEWERFFDAR